MTAPPPPTHPADGHSTKKGEGAGARGGGCRVIEWHVTGEQYVPRVYVLADHRPTALTAESNRFAERRP